jgi:agmatinase
MNSKNKKFDPNETSQFDGIFGLPFNYEESKLIYLPVPWEVTTSYGSGTSLGPSSIKKASKQIDLYHSELGSPYKHGLYFIEPSNEIIKLNTENKILAQKIIHALENKTNENEKVKIDEFLNKVNQASIKLNEYVYLESKKILSDKKILSIIGGDHSVPLGAIKAISETVSSFSILHIDAHSDTRNQYEGFHYSHASIMRNVVNEIKNLNSITQVAIRDFCEEELNFTLKEQKSKFHVFFDKNLKEEKFLGKSWHLQCEKIIETLSSHVWISFDIDGLDPKLCPHTGTPVPGGLDFHEAIYLIKLLAKSNKKILGFDLCEVSPNLNDPQNEWDANVGMRLLYELSAWTLYSQGFC